ncbi:MAG: hypothetical protein UX45_C0019G0003 [Candidatus Uhrbacteria bacterium GW2011_GWF2_46_218]|uniref:Uncharacterized protein n=1 Tax=Candidatus Uhrbacteria bacterium GW2011_GWF2_46_218 TaxID=1619001 RepID=A0A0G1SG64_9BACT|nr:MAG: hypothetical protein UX45_C0019G0003 [Candidatus Uhrbacteria bacterium GW2011_GWF2_46_218]
MATTAPRATRRYVRPTSPTRTLASDPACELKFVDTATVAIGDENGMDLSEMALENLGIVPEVFETETAQRARRASQDMFLMVDELSDEDVCDSSFFSFNEEEPDGDPDPETDTDCDDTTEEIKFEGTPPDGRDALRCEQMARQATAEERDRNGRAKAKAHLAKLARRDAARPVPTPVVESAPAPAEPTRTEKLESLRAAFTAAVMSKNFSLADALNAQIKTLVVEIEAEKVQTEKIEAKAQAVEEAKQAEKRIPFLRGKITELRTALFAPGKEIGELIAICSGIARYEYELNELELKIAPILEARAQAEAKRQAEIASRPAPAAQAPKVTRRCKVCGKEISGDVMVPHFGEIERRRSLSLDPKMTVEQVYGDLFFHQECMAKKGGIQGRAYTLGRGNVNKNLEIWCAGRGRRAEAAEERKLNRENPTRDRDMSRPPRTWSSAPPAKAWRRTA